MLCMGMSTMGVLVAYLRSIQLQKHAFNKREKATTVPAQACTSVAAGTVLLLCCFQQTKYHLLDHCLGNQQPMLVAQRSGQDLPTPLEPSCAPVSGAGGGDVVLGVVGGGVGDGSELELLAVGEICGAEAPGADVASQAGGVGLRNLGLVTLAAAQGMERAVAHDAGAQHRRQANSILH